MKVAVIFGGRSTENYVSRMSVKSVINVLYEGNYEIVAIGITKEGQWLHYIGDINDVTKDDWTDHVEKDDKNNAVNGIEKLMEEDIDIMFPVLHGVNGEDGTIQGLFELLGKPYVGNGVLASAMSMDKAYTKIICKEEGIPQCGYCVFQRWEIERNIAGCINIIEDKIGYPNFVKPSNAGSSLGITKAKNREDLKRALIEASEYDFRVVVEEFVDGREIECAVLGNIDPAVAVPAEIISANEFYDYEAKYFNELSNAEVPAKITEEQRDEVTGYAKRIFQKLDCSGLARVDFFLENKTGKFIFNEINTLPGFTDISAYAKMWAESGVTYKELLDRLIRLAAENYEARKRKYTI